MINRPRRLRLNKKIRSLVRETSLHPQDLIYPMFVTEGRGVKQEIAAMPGQYRWSVDMLPAAIREVEEAGVEHIMLFGIPAPEDHDECGSAAWASDGIVQRAIAEIKSHSDIFITTDVCLCEYTSHGHCGQLDADGYVNNDKTLELLAKTALSHVEAGADMVAPSDMMDGRVAAIREGLDRAGFTQTPIMAYSAKFASAYYGPFRDAAHSAPGFGDRKSYQMDCANGQEALREIRADIEEGADIVMVKPALAYLDVLKEAALTFDMPLAVYNVSGEYAMVKAAAANGWIDERRIVLENLTAMKRAGAKIIITYHALEAAAWEKDR